MASCRGISQGVNIYLPTSQTTLRPQTGLSVNTHKSGTSGPLSITRSLGFQSYSRRTTVSLSRRSFCFLSLPIYANFPPATLDCQEALLRPGSTKVNSLFKSFLQKREHTKRLESTRSPLRRAQLCVCARVSCCLESLHSASERQRQTPAYSLFPHSLRPFALAPDPGWCELPNLPNLIRVSVGYIQLSFIFNYLHSFL